MLYIHLKAGASAAALVLLLRGRGAEEEEEASVDLACQVGGQSDGSAMQGVGGHHVCV